jgi:hypothetical protein
MSSAKEFFVFIADCLNTFNPKYTPRVSEMCNAEAFSFPVVNTLILAYQTEE